MAGSRQQVVTGEAADGLVYFLPKAGSPRPKPGRYSINTHSKGFTPTTLVVPMGSTVSFPNKDDILHNVFSRTPGTTFDFGFYGPGETRRHVFARPGLVIVNCNVHHNMRANVVVLETPYYARPDDSGRYRIENVPAGPGTLVFWHPRSRAQTVAISGATDAVVRRLTADKPRIDPHAAMTR